MLKKELPWWVLKKDLLWWNEKMVELFNWNHWRKINLTHTVNTQNKDIVSISVNCCVVIHAPSFPCQRILLILHLSVYLVGWLSCPSSVCSDRDMAIVKKMYYCLFSHFSLLIHGCLLLAINHIPPCTFLPASWLTVVCCVVCVTFCATLATLAAIFFRLEVINQQVTSCLDSELTMLTPPSPQ